MVISNFQCFFFLSVKGKQILLKLPWITPGLLYPNISCLCISWIIYPYPVQKWIILSLIANMSSLSIHMQLTVWPIICCKGRLLKRQLSQWYPCSGQAERTDQACTNSIILALFLILPPYREGLLQAQQKRASAAVSCYLPSAAGHSCLPGELLVHHFHPQMLTQMFFQIIGVIPQAPTQPVFITLLKIPIQNMFDCTFLQLGEI